MVLEELLEIERHSGLKSLAFVAQPTHGGPIVGVAGRYQSNPDIALPALRLLEDRLRHRKMRWERSFKEKM